MNQRVAALEGCDLTFIVINADDVVADLCEANSGNKADIA